MSLASSSSQVDGTERHPLESSALPTKLLNQGGRHGQWDLWQEEGYWVEEDFLQVIFLCEVQVGLDTVDSLLES